MIPRSRFIRCRRAVQGAVMVLLAAAGLLAGGAQAQSDLLDPSYCDTPPPGYGGEPGRRAPAVTGSLVEALAILGADQVQVRRVEVAADAPAWQVVNQWPKPGEPILGGRMVLCVSVGPSTDPDGQGDEMLMPSLTGMTVEEARRALAAQEIPNEPEIRRAPHATAAPDRIYRQSPAADAPVTDADDVILEVSDGPEIDPPQDSMPPLTGMTVAEARRVLEAREISSQLDIRRSTHATAPRDRIFGQSPAAGAPVKEVISLDVSDGPPQVLMPTLTGMTLEGARQALAARQIRNGPEIRRARHARVARDRIYRQSPAAGAPVTAADAVILDVSDGPPPAVIRMPSLTNMTVAEARRALAARQIPNQPEIRRAHHASAAQDAIYRQSPAAGAPVTEADAIFLEVSDGPPPASAPAVPNWVVVPPLQRLPEADAVARLEREGLRAVARGSRHSAYAAGQVIETRPAAGERVERGAPIYYALSLGPAESDPRPGGNRWLLVAILAAAALAAAALAAKPVMAALLPRFEVRMAGPPMPSIEWGEPPGLEFEVVADPPVHSCRIETANPPGETKGGMSDG